MNAIRPTFGEFYLGLDIKQRQSFAKSAGTTERYLTYKLLGGQRMPRVGMIDKLVRASAQFHRPFTREELLQFFYALHVAHGPVRRMVAEATA